MTHISGGDELGVVALLCRQRPQPCAVHRLRGGRVDLRSQHTGRSPGVSMVSAGLAGQTALSEPTSPLPPPALCLCGGRVDLCQQRQHCDKHAQDEQYQQSPKSPQPPAVHLCSGRVDLRQQQQASSRHKQHSHRHGGHARLHSTFCAAAVAGLPASAAREHISRHKQTLAAPVEPTPACRPPSLW